MSSCRYMSQVSVLGPSPCSLCGRCLPLTALVVASRGLLFGPPFSLIRASNTYSTTSNFKRRSV
jgi:hypothetical protein